MIVRGPLGAGKTTVARALAGRVGATVLSIDDLVEDGWDGGSEALFLRANEAAAPPARELLVHGTPVIFDGNFYWRRAVDDLAERLRVPHVVFSLQVPLPVCIQRDRDRPHAYGEEATREVYEKVRRSETGIPIDGTRPVAEIVAALVARLPPT